MNKILIGKTCLPEDQISYSDWVREFNVGTNVPMSYGRSTKYDLNYEYDFTKLFKQSSKSIFNFFWILEKLNIFA
jgi:hypothetical protein